MIRAFGGLAKAEMAMPDSYPYIVSNNKIEPILARVRTAAKPERFTIRETLHKWGFTTSNDRAIIGVLKELGFLNEGGAPTSYYDRLKDQTEWRYVLAERMRALYADLFAIDSNIQRASESEIKGAISRVTGKDEESVKRYYATFKTLAGLANFDDRPARTPKAEKQEDVQKKTDERHGDEATPARRRPDFHYNIQIHLPVTTDITVYNAIFKSLKENLGI
jgi:hypothetical protein